MQAGLRRPSSAQIQDKLSFARQCHTYVTSRPAGLSQKRCVRAVNRRSDAIDCKPCLFGPGSKRHVQIRPRVFWLAWGVCLTSGMTRRLAPRPRNLFATIRFGASLSFLKSRLNNHRATLVHGGFSGAAVSRHFCSTTAFSIIASTFARWSGSEAFANHHGCRRPDWIGAPHAKRRPGHDAIWPPSNFF